MNYEKHLREIDKSLQAVVSKFFNRPHLFFNESGFHCYCFAAFYRNPLFRKLFKTRDGKFTNLIHPSYGSTLKFEKFGKKEGRAWYDIAILNPKFIENNDFRRVTGNYFPQIKKCGYKTDDLLAVFEFKFIKCRSESYRKQLRKDYISLKNAKEAIRKYMVVFSLVDNEMDYFKGMDWIQDLRLIYAKVYFDKENRKHFKVTIKPNNFLSLPLTYLKK